MRRSAAVIVFVMLSLWLASGVAQTPGTGAGGGLVLTPINAAGGTGVSNAPLIDRAEIRVLRVDVAPNGVRNVHAHNDMQYHLFIPVSGNMRLEADPEKPAELGPWQAYFIKGGMQHGFRNTGTTTATIMEIFVKK